MMVIATLRWRWQWWCYIIRGIVSTITMDKTFDEHCGWCLFLDRRLWSLSTSALHQHREGWICMVTHCCFFGKLHSQFLQPSDLVDVQSLQGRRIARFWPWPTPSGSPMVPTPGGEWSSWYWAAYEGRSWQWFNWAVSPWPHQWEIQLLIRWCLASPPKLPPQQPDLWQLHQLQRWKSCMRRRKQNMYDIIWRTFIYIVQKSSSHI